MSIIEFIIGLLILVASLLASTICYFVKNEKSGVNAALGGASDFMATRRNNDNGKLNKVVAVSASAVVVLILALTVYGAVVMENAKEKTRVRDIPAKALNLIHPSSVTWLSGAETTKRTGVILAVVAATSLFMVAADTLFGALLKLIV